MPPDQHAPGSPESWLLYAKSDLDLARVSRPPGVLFEGLCFHAQQAAEKALKALFVAWAIPVPRTHNIGMLLDLMPKELTTSSDIQEAAI